MLRIFGLLIFTYLITFFAYSQNHASAQPIAGTNIYSTRATFSIDGAQKPMASVIATIENRPLYGPRYKWLILNFYAFTLTQENIASAKVGNIEPIEKRRYEGDTKAYNNSNAKFVLSIDSTNNQITQVDMAVPGYGCTVGGNAEDLRQFSQNYSFANKHLQLKSSGSYECSLSSRKTLFGWDFDVDVPVIQKQTAKK